jgi:hypothetical protein
MRKLPKPNLKHTYPEGHVPGKYWNIDEAFEILNKLVPGRMSDDERDMLAFVIAAHLMRERNRAIRIAERAHASAIAEAIRKGCV